MSAEKWPRSVVRRRDEEAKSGLCAFLSAASNILHIVRIDTRMTYYPPVPAINTLRERSPCVNCTAGKCRYTERFFKGSRGGTRSELRSAGQTNKPFQTKKATSVLCQSHTFKGKLVPSIHLDETQQTISNLFQYYSHRNNKAEILLRPQHFIKGRKNLLG